MWLENKLYVFLKEESKRDFQAPSTSSEKSQIEKEC
jgi:hypothetical protein